MSSFTNFISNLMYETISAVFTSLEHNWKVLTITIFTAVLFKTYVNTEKFSDFMMKRKNVSIFACVAVGAFTPFCACGTTAIIIGMLTTTLPWGPIMAFLTSSPLMSPDGFVMIAGVIGFRFALGLTIASLIIGILSGFITNIIERKTGFLDNQTRYLDEKQAEALSCSCSGKAEASSCCEVQTNIPGCSCFEQAQVSNCCAPQISISGCSCAEKVQISSCCTPKTGKINDFVDKFKLRQFADAFVNLGLKQILLYFSIFVAVGYLINYFIPPSIINVLFGANSIFAVPLAALIGLPLYITTESGIPIIQSMIQSGASEGAMLAFLITGSATSAWVIAGLMTFLKKRAIALYVGYVLAGGILSGYIYDLIVSISNGF